MYYRANKINPFIELDRYFVYRIYKKAGISTESSGLINKSVTHAFRHMAAKEIRVHSNSNEFVTTALHHKSNKSQEHYGNK
jgi:hypothetical protein